MPLIRGGVALCNFSFPLSTTFFKVFFGGSAFGVALIGAAVPQRVFELCPFYPALSNTFFAFCGTFFVHLHQSFDNIYYFIENFFNSPCPKSLSPALFRPRKASPSGGRSLSGMKKQGEGRAFPLLSAPENAFRTLLSPARHTFGVQGHTSGKTPCFLF